MSLEIGDIIVTPHDSPYVLIEEVEDHHWRVFFLARQVYRSLPKKMIQRHIESMNDGAQNLIRDR